MVDISIVFTTLTPLYVYVRPLNPHTTTVIVGIIENVENFKVAPWSIWFVAVIFQPIGCAFGYFVSRNVVKLRNKECRTICLETGVQNFALTIAVVNLSFADDEALRNKVMLFPVTYGLMYIINSVVLVLLLKLHVSKFDEPEEEKEGEADEKEGEVEGGKVEDASVGYTAVELKAV